MQISDKGIDLISSFEGLYTKAYLCPASVWTIGIGETGKFALTGQTIKEGLTITTQQAKDSFRIAIKSYEKAVNNLKLDINQNQYDALVSFCYNLGTGIFTGSLLTALKSKNWTSVTNQMLLYNKARVNGVLTILNGLDRRRKAEVELFNTPVKTTPTEDKELSQAVSKLIKSGISIDFNSWKRVDLINLKNVDALITKLGGLDKLVKQGVISDTTLWKSGKYNTNHARSLIIKYASTLK